MEKKDDRCDGVVDPLANYWGLSLFPSTSDVPPPSEPYDDLDAIHNHLRSMALRSPNKLAEQAKAILDENPGLLFNSENSTHDERSDVIVAAEEGEGKFPRNRRPGLGHKPARFTFKQPKKQTVEDLLPTLDLDNLKDPVEFFLAHEKLENARREIQKQLGIVPVEPNQDDISTKPRKRRPGLLGDKSRPVKYRHRYSTETLKINDDVPSSQEAFGSQSDSRDPVDENTDKGGACLASLENEVTDSSAVEENNLDDILQGLLCCDPEDLEGDGAISLLQERLQIKPIVAQKLSVPDFPDNQLIDLKSLRGNLSKPRKALSNIDNLLKGMRNKTPVRQDVGCAVQQLASPTPPRSPFALLSSLQKHISRSRPSVDPFSAHEIDHLSTKNHSPTHMINQEVNLVGSGKASNNESNAQIIEDVIAAGETNTILDTSENSKEDNSGMSSDKLNAPLIEDIVAVSETSLDEDPVRNCTSTSQKSKVDNSREAGFGSNVDSNEPHVDMDVDIGGNGMGKGDTDDTVGRHNVEPNEPSQFEDKEKTDGTMEPVNGQKKVKLCSRKMTKDKRLLQRQSLAGAGTSWKSGLRRSTRIRTRPLEYWKGERPVYGRVHESLATVIGVKCMSPGSDGKPTMKVKSFVSDKYKELLEIASLY